MNDLIEFFRDFFNFKVIVDNFKHFLLRFSSIEELDEFNLSFSAGVQKTIILGILIVANNFVYRRDDAAVEFTKQIVPVIISGFAVFIIITFTLYIVTMSTQKAKAASNILIMHLIITMSVLLIFVLSGLSRKFDNFMFFFAPKNYNVAEYGRFISYVLISILSLLTTLALIINTLHHDFRGGNLTIESWKIYLFRGAIVTLLSVMLIGTYVVNKIPDGQIIAP